MRVFDCNTQKVCEIGLFEDEGWEDAIPIRLLELPLIFGELGLNVGCLEVWDCPTHYSASAAALDFFIPDEVLKVAFQQQWGDPEQPWGKPSFDSSLKALKTLIFASPRFRAAVETDKIVA